MDESLPQPNAHARNVFTAVNFGACIWLLGSLFILIAAGLLQHDDGREVLLPWLGIPLPETCTTRGRFGIECPGCGLTRCFIHLADGEFATAWDLHPVGVLIFAFTIVQVPLALAHCLNLKHRFVTISTRVNERIFMGLGVLLVGWWIWRWIIIGDLTP